MSNTYYKDQQIMDVICDSCDYQDEFYGDFRQCILEMKENGWRFKDSENGTWQHFCEDCAKAYGTRKNQKKTFNFPVDNE